MGWVVLLLGKFCEVRYSAFSVVGSPSVAVSRSVACEPSKSLHQALAGLSEAARHGERVDTASGGTCHPVRPSIILEICKDRYCS